MVKLMTQTFKVGYYSQITHAALSLLLDSLLYALSMTSVSLATKAPHLG